MSRRWIEVVLACAAVFMLGVTIAGCIPTGPSQPEAECFDIDEEGFSAPPDKSKPFVWLGTNDASDTSFRAIAPNETLPMQFGAQGGQHVWGAVRLYAPKDGGWRVQFKIVDAMGEPVAGVEEFVEACEGGVAELHSATVFLNEEQPVPMGVLSVDAIPTSGETLHAEVPISVM